MASIDLEQTFSTTELNAIRRTVRSGGYHLFLGAGATFGSATESGFTIGGGRELTQQLANSFSVPFEDGDMLWRVYQRAEDRVGRARVYEWLRARFIGVIPPEWMKLMTSFDWEIVWTLNIDDAFERAYLSVATEYSRKLNSASWDDDFSTNASELKVVHLHGHVHSEKPRKLVFSLSEYANSAAAAGAWPLTFRDSYGVSPLIVIGARMRDEPDIESVISRGRPSTAVPSLYISPSISDGMRSDLEKWGMVPLAMTAQDFIEQLAVLCDVLEAAGPTRHDEIALRVGRQFTELRLDKRSVETYSKDVHDFLGGDVPKWADIESSRHAVFSWVDQVKPIISRMDNGRLNSASMLVLLGRHLSGRTTGLYAIARLFRENGWRTFIYSTDEKLDHHAILTYLSDGKKLLLCFDGVADYAEDVNSLLQRARAASLSLAVLAVDRPDNAVNITGRIETAFLVDRTIFQVPNRMNATDSRRLVDRLEEQGRLGKLEPLVDYKRVGHFSGSFIFDAMSKVEDAPGFGKRVGQLVGRISDHRDLELVFLASIASKFDQEFLIMDAARMLSRTVKEIYQRITKSSVMIALVTSEGRWIRSRQRDFALEPAVAALGEGHCLTMLATGLKRISPRAGRAGHFAKNATSGLVGTLMTHRNLLEVFPDANLESWYESLAAEFSNSGRFWEQRAIMSRRLSTQESLARAESFARRAISLKQDTYSYTTLGTVLAARAASAAVIDIGRYYDEAYDAFDQASELDLRNRVTWLAFLHYAIPVVDAVVKLEGEKEDLMERVVDDWERIFEHSSRDMLVSEDLRKDLSSLRRRFDRARG